MRALHRAAVRCTAACLVLAAAAGCTRHDTASAAARPELRICADPNNLPFSNDRLEGFENRIADLLARDMGAVVRYTWWAQRRGFLRSTLNAGECNLVIGLPAGMEMALTTRPYYRSSYVFVTRRDRGLSLRWFDDERLRTLRVGVQLVGDDGANTPPAHALSRRGIVRNVVGYSVYGDYRDSSPPSSIIRAVAAGDIDVAVAWGPMAGYFARRQAVPLAVSAVAAPSDGPAIPLAFDMAMAVRRDSPELRAALDAFIERRRSDIDAVLNEFAVPRTEAIR